jgi:P4 family phage/plasmid primase-like protien
MSFTRQQYETFWTHELENYHSAGAGHLRAPCPIHQGDSPDTLSVDLNTGFAYCFKCHNGNKGWSMVEFAMARHGFNKQCAWDYVRGIVGDLSKPSIAPWRFPFPQPLTITDDDWRLGTLSRRIVQYVEWLDAQGNPGWEAYALYPYEPIDSTKIRARHKVTGEKRMLWLSLTAKGGWTKPSKLGLEAPPYRARSLAGKEEIWLLNGEKAVDRAITDWEITATCLPNGEGHWKPEYLRWFQGAKEIYLVLDNDPSGEKHGEIVGGALALAGLSARLVRLPGLAEKADLWDYIEAGGTLAQAREIARESPAAEPAAPPEPKGKVRQMPRRGPPPGGGGDSGPPIEGPDLTGYDRNDRGNAARLVAFAGDRLRYARQLEEAWLYFDGTRWKTGAVEEAFRPAGETLVLLKQQANAQKDDRLWKFADSKQNAGGIRAMIDLSRKELAIDVDKLDQHPHLINCTNGTFDLTTGALREHRASDYLTHLFPFAYDPQAAEPALFLRSLFEWFGGNPELSEGDLERIDRLIDYMQRVIGYLLTGEVREKAFFVLYGTGNNGKSTLIDTLLAIYGDYAVTISPGTLTKGYGKNENNANADIARTKGARAIFTSEPDEGGKFDQGLLKKLTQGDVPITGVFKGQQPFSFRPTGKLVLETNTIPDFNDDDAFSVRMHPIRFPMKFEVSARAGQTRRELLRAEDALIFNWALAGARDWHANGLMEPLEDRQQQMATIRDEQARNDGLEPFLEEFFDIGPGLRCTLADIETLHRTWSERFKGRLIPRNRLSRMLTRRANIKRGNDPNKDHKTPAWLQGLAPKNRSGWSGNPQTKEPDDDDD